MSIIQERIETIRNLLGLRRLTTREIASETGLKTTQVDAAMRRGIAEGRFDRARADSPAHFEFAYFVSTGPPKRTSKPLDQPCIFPVNCPCCGAERQLELDGGDANELVNRHARMAWDCDCGNHVRLSTVVSQGDLIRAMQDHRAANNPDTDVSMPRVSIGRWL